MEMTDVVVELRAELDDLILAGVNLVRSYAEL
jgi:hypothetical protein